MLLFNLDPLRRPTPVLSPLELRSHTYFASLVARRTARLFFPVDFAVHAARSVPTAKNLAPRYVAQPSIVLHSFASIISGEFINFEYYFKYYYYFFVKCELSLIVSPPRDIPILVFECVRIVGDGCADTTSCVLVQLYYFTTARDTLHASLAEVFQLLNRFRVVQRSHMTFSKIRTD